MTREGLPGGPESAGRNDPVRTGEPEGERPRDAATHPGARAMQSRERHDTGAQGDKIPVSDPAATPLGTDSEAAGVRQPEGAMEPPPARDSPEPGDGFAKSGGTPHGHARGEYETGSGRWVWIGAAAAVALLLGLMVFVVTVG